MKYTPGPWTCSHPTTDMNGDNRCRSIKSGIKWVAIVGRQVDARVIAAVPEMYEIMIELSRDLTSVYSSRAQDITNKVEGNNEQDTDNTHDDVCIKKYICF